MASSKAATLIGCWVSAAGMTQLHSTRLPSLTSAYALQPIPATIAALSANRSRRYTSPRAPFACALAPHAPLCCPLRPPGCLPNLPVTTRRSASEHCEPTMADHSRSPSPPADRGSGVASGGGSRSDASALQETMSFIRASLARRVDTFSRAWPSAASSIFSVKDEPSDFEPLLAQDGIFLFFAASPL